jgi:toxin ParE1/3/4
MGLFKVVFVPRARDDLQSIVRFIANQNSPAVAERLGLNLIEKALGLSTFPERGRVVPELRDSAVREIFFKTYRIVFRIRGQTVEVIRFWHAARGTPEIDSDEFSQT